MNPPHPARLALALSLLGFCACLLWLTAPHLLTVAWAGCVGFADLVNRFSAVIALGGLLTGGVMKLKKVEVKV